MSLEKWHASGATSQALSNLMGLGKCHACVETPHARSNVTGLEKWQASGETSHAWSSAASMESYHRSRTASGLHRAGGVLLFQEWPWMVQVIDIPREIRATMYISLNATALILVPPCIGASR